MVGVGAEWGGCWVGLNNRFFLTDGRLAAGIYSRAPCRSGTWYLIMLPADHETKGLQAVPWIMKLRLFCWHVSNLFCHVTNAAANQCVPSCDTSQAGPFSVPPKINPVGHFWPSLPLEAKATPRWHEGSNQAKEKCQCGAAQSWDLQNLERSQTIRSVTAQRFERRVPFPPGLSLTDKPAVIWART